MKAVQPCQRVRPCSPSPPLRVKARQQGRRLASISDYFIKKNKVGLLLNRVRCRLTHTQVG